MKKALRMGCNSYFEEENFAKNLALVKDNLDVVEEITLFTEPTHHGYWPLSMSAETAAILKDRIRRYKEIGVPRVGLNVLCTLGHTEDGASIAPVSDIQYVMNIDGVVSRSCLCPSDDRFMPYIAKRYEMFSQVGADFIWLDDDLRVTGHGIMREACFCPECLKKYNAKFGTSLTIEEVRTRYKNEQSFRDTWRESACDTMLRLLKTIRHAMESTDPTIEIGYMSCLAATVPEWIDACGATLGRPGGGFYNDLMPIQMFEKFFTMQQIVKRYPDIIKDIQYEYEQYNFLTLQKSLHISELETSLMILSGCNGMLYNRWEHTQDFLDMMRASAKKWDVLADITKDRKPAGVYCVSCWASRCLNEIGIPTTTYKENASLFYILSDEWNDFSDEEIEEMLKTGVYTDGEGLMRLEARGFGDLGGKIAERYQNGVWEHFPDHPLNGNPRNRERFVSMDIFHEADAFALTPDEGAETISQLNSAFGGLRGCSAYVYRRRDGSVLAVDGCLIPKQIQTYNKKTQMTNVFELISGNKMPVVIEKSIKVAPVVSTNGDKMTVLLTNAHFDPTGEFEVKIRTDKELMLLAEDGSFRPIKQTKGEKETVVTVDNIGPWQYLILTTKA